MSKLSRELNRFLKRLRGWLVSLTPKTQTNTPVIPVPSVPIPPAGDFLCAGFLGDNASKRYMDLLNPRFSFTDFVEYVKRHKAHGFNQMLFALYNEHDGPWAGYNVIAGDIDQALKKLHYAREQGMNIQLWVITDDNPKLYKTGKKDFKRIESMYKKAFETYWAYTDSWCVMLEYEDSRWSEENIAKLIKILKQQWQSVAIHSRSYKGVRAAIRMGADILNAQWRGNASEEQMRKGLDYLDHYVDEIDIVACEFHRSSFSAQATKLADIARSYHWCKGTQTGRISR